MSDEALVPVVAVAVTCGGPLLWGIVHSLASNWRQVKVAEQNAQLKREMVERGYSADEIARVLEAGAPADPNVEVVRELKAGGRRCG